jgi:putative FmdB family regulatory protein
MPIYEYHCSDCRKKTSVFLRSFSEKSDPVCSHCGGRLLTRLFSRFAAPKSEEARMERLADPSSWGGLDEKDPKSVAQWTRKMGKEMGEDLGGLEQDLDAMAEGGVEDGGAGGLEDPGDSGIGDG